MPLTTTVAALALSLRAPPTQRAAVTMELGTIERAPHFRAAYLHSLPRLYMSAAAEDDDMVPGLRAPPTQRAAVAMELGTIERAPHFRAAYLHSLPRLYMSAAEEEDDRCDRM